MKRRIVCTLCAVMAAGFLLCGCGASSEELENNRSTGIEQLNNGDYESAQKSFEAALADADKKLSELETDTMLYLALAQVKNDDLEGAKESYKKIMKSDDTDYRPYFLRGCVELQEKDIDAAVSDFEAALNLEGNSLELYINIYENLEEYDAQKQAQSLIGPALDLKAEDAEEKAQYGYLEYLLGDKESSETTLTEAAEKSTLAILYQGITSAKSGDLSRAETYFDQYADATADDSDCLTRVGTAALRSGDYEAAIRYFTAASEALTGTDDAYRTVRKNLVTAYEYNGDYEEAAKVLEEYLQNYPDDAAAVKELQFVETRI